MLNLKQRKVLAITVCLLAPFDLMAQVPREGVEVMVSQSIGNCSESTITLRNSGLNNGELLMSALFTGESKSVKISKGQIQAILTSPADRRGFPIEKHTQKFIYVFSRPADRELPLYRYYAAMDLGAKGYGHMETQVTSRYMPGIYRHDYGGGLVKRQSTNFVGNTEECHVKLKFSGQGSPTEIGLSTYRLPQTWGVEHVQPEGYYKPFGLTDTNRAFFDGEEVTPRAAPMPIENTNFGSVFGQYRVVLTRSTTSPTDLSWRASTDHASSGYDMKSMSPEVATYLQEISASKRNRFVCIIKAGVREHTSACSRCTGDIPIFQLHNCEEMD